MKSVIFECCVCVVTEEIVASGRNILPWLVTEERFVRERRGFSTQVCGGCKCLTGSTGSRDDLAWAPSAVYINKGREHSCFIDCLEITKHTSNLQHVWTRKRRQSQGKGQVAFKPCWSAVPRRQNSPSSAQGKLWREDRSWCTSLPCRRHGILGR